MEFDRSTHAVQFYEDDCFLAESVATYVSQGLSNGQGVVIIATRAHRELMEKVFHKRGCDVGREQASGQLQVLDAHDTLGLFMVDGRVDAARFEETVGSLVREMKRRYPKLRAYGEMVDILWAQGATGAVIALEEHWNALIRDQGFSLLCGYRMGAFEPEAHSGEFIDICHTHSHVIPVVEEEPLHDGERQRREIARLQQKAQLLRERGDQLSIARHELTTPITSLKLQIELIRELAGDGKQITRALDVCDRQIVRLTSLVKNLLDDSSLEIGSWMCRQGPVELSSLVLGVKAELDESLSQAGITMTLDLSEGVKGNWDAVRLEQVMINLLTNVVKHAPGSSAKVSVARTEDHALVTVEDTGPGVPLDCQPHIFKRFGRAVGSKNVSGMGVGLFLVKEIVAAHQGSVHFESVLGQGATFQIRLPMKTWTE